MTFITFFDKMVFCKCVPVVGLVMGEDTGPFTKRAYTVKSEKDRGTDEL
jgi:hypothetical protein